jgi:hypothetical protein
VSQAGSAAGSTPPPIVPTTFVANTGTATPALNILNVLGNDTQDNNPNGITTVASGNTVNYLLTNRLYGTATTTGAATENLIVFDLDDLGADGVITVNIDIAGFDTTSNALGAGFTVTGSVKIIGGTATVLNNQVVDTYDETGTENTDADIDASGSNLIVEVTGEAGTNIRWVGSGIYVFAS